MNGTPVKEMRVTEILRAAFRFYKADFKLIVPLCLMVFVPVNIIELFVPSGYSIMAFLADPTGLIESGAYNSTFLFYYVTLALRMVFTCLIAGGFTYIAVSRMRGQPVTAAGLMDFSVGKWGRLAVTSLLYYAIVSITSVLIFPAIYFAIAFIFHLNIAAATPDKGFKALLGSARIIKGRFIKSLFYIIAMNGLALLFSILLSTIVSFIPTLAAAPVTIPEKVLYVLTYSIIETLCAVFTLAQAVWFTNILENAVKQQQ